MSLVRVVAAGDRGRERTLRGKGRDPQGRKFKVFLTYHPDFEALLATYNVKVCLRPGQTQVSDGFDRRHIIWLPGRGNFQPRVTYHPNQYGIRMYVDDTPEPERDYDGHIITRRASRASTATVSTGPDSLSDSQKVESSDDEDDYASWAKYIDGLEMK